MKRFIILGLLIVGAGACTSPEREEWDSGGDATRAQQQQSEEERVDAETEQIDKMIYRVIHHNDRIEDEPIADIIWLKRAADVALENGSPYFHVIEQTVTKEFNREHNMNLTLIEGIIELDQDPMNAEYDAYVISELELDPFAR